jgi:hypothetical protein
MKIIIEHSVTKREIVGSFNICGSGKDLRELARQLLDATKDDGFYGWIQISEKQPMVCVNSAPDAWDEKQTFDKSPE